MDNILFLRKPRLCLEKPQPEWIQLSENCILYSVTGIRVVMLENLRVQRMWMVATTKRVIANCDTSAWRYFRLIVDFFTDNRRSRLVSVQWKSNVAAHVGILTGINYRKLTREIACLAKFPTCCVRVWRVHVYRPGRNRPVANVRVSRYVHRWSTVDSHARLDTVKTRYTCDMNV